MRMCTLRTPNKEIRFEGLEETQAAAEHEEGEVDIVSTFIPYSQAPLQVEPCVGVLDHPGVPTQQLLRLDTGPSDTRSDAASVQAPAVVERRVRLVCVQFAGTMSGATPVLLHVGHRLQLRGQLASVVDVGSR